MFYQDQLNTCLFNLHAKNSRGTPRQKCSSNVIPTITPFMQSAKKKQKNRPTAWTDAPTVCVHVTL